MAVIRVLYFIQNLNFKTGLKEKLIALHEILHQHKHKSFNGTLVNQTQQCIKNIINLKLMDLSQTYQVV